MKIIATLALIIDAIAIIANLPFWLLIISWLVALSWTCWGIANVLLDERPNRKSEIVDRK